MLGKAGKISHYSTFVVFMLVIGLLITSLALFDPSITGSVIIDSSKSLHVPVNIVYDLANGQELRIPFSDLNLTLIDALSISGNANINTSFIVTLETENESILVFEHKAVRPKPNLITGFVTGDASELNTEQEKNNTKQKENKTKDGDEKIVVTNISELIDESVVVPVVNVTNDSNVSMELNVFVNETNVTNFSFVNVSNASIVLENFSENVTVVVPVLNVTNISNVSVNVTNISELINESVVVPFVNVTNSSNVSFELNESVLDFNVSVNETNVSISPLVNTSNESLELVNETNLTIILPQTFSFTFVNECVDSCVLDRLSNATLVISGDGLIYINDLSVVVPSPLYQLKNISDIIVPLGVETSIDLDGYFFSGNELFYDIPSLDANVSIDGSILSFFSSLEDEITLFVYVTDGEDVITSNEFTITVGNIAINVTEERSRWVLKNNVGNNIAVVYEDGTMDIAGTIITSNCPTPESGEEFIIKSKDGTDVITINNNGDLQLCGTITTNATTPPGVASEVIIQDKEGVWQAYFSENGDIYLKGTLNENQIIT